MTRSLSLSLALLAVVPLTAGGAGPGASSRATVELAVFLELDGALTDRVSFASGGDTAVKAVLGDDLTPSIQGVIGEPLVLELPAASLSVKAQTWLSSAFGGSPGARAALVLVDGSNREVERLNLGGARLQRLQLPGWDGALANDPIRVVLVGTFVRSRSAPGAALTLPAAGRPLKKARLVVSGLESAVVEKLSGLDFVLRADLTRDYEVQAPRLATLSARLAPGNGQPAAPWQSWLQGVQNGTATEPERQGRVEYLDDTGAVALSAVLGPLVIRRVEEEFMPAVSRRTHLTLVGQGTVAFGGASAAGSSPGARAFGHLERLGTSGVGVTVESAEWSVARIAYLLGEAPFAPAPEAPKKFLLVHLKVRNVSPGPLDLGVGALTAGLLDTAGKVFDGTERLVGATDSRSVQASLAPGAELRAMTWVLVDAASQPALLSLTSGADTIRYDLTQAVNRVTKLAPPLVAATDASGAIALETVAVKKGFAFPVGDFDLTFTGASRSSQIFGSSDGPRWLATFTVKNRTLGPSHFDLQSLEVTAAMGLNDVGAESRAYAADSTRPVSVDLRPGGEVTVRYPFPAPAGATPTRLTVKAGASRRFVLGGADLATK